MLTTEDKKKLLEDYCNDLEDCRFCVFSGKNCFSFEKMTKLQTDTAYMLMMNFSERMSG